MSGYTQAQDFTIKVLEGPDAGAVITLQGRALPYRGVTFGVKQRVKTTWYPGNPVATQQVMGPTETPTTITGAWKDYFLGNGQARKLGALFDGLCRSGFLVELTWGSQFFPLSGGGHQVIDTAPIVRQGIIANYEPTFDRSQEFGWKMDFEWRGRDDAAAPVKTETFRDSDGYDTTVLRFQGALDAISAFRNSPIAKMITGLPGVVATQLDAVQEVVDAAISTLATATRTVKEISDIPDNVRQSAQGAASQASVAMRAATEAVINLPLAGTVPQDDALSTLEAWSQQQEFTSELDAAREEAYLLEQLIAAEITPPVLTEIRVPEGTDLRLLALKYYGDPDLWTVIADFNGMAGSRVPNNPRGISDRIGSPIRIPRLGARNAQRQLSV